MGFEPVAVLFRQLPQRLQNFVDPAVPRVLQGAATERREPGSKYDPGVKQVGITDYVFVQACDGLVQYR